MGQNLPRPGNDCRCCRPPRSSRHHLRDERRKLPPPCRARTKARSRPPARPRDNRGQCLIVAPRQYKSSIPLARQSRHGNHANVATPDSHPDCRVFPSRSPRYSRRLEYPALKRAVREQQSLFGANEVLIEDKASGTQLIQELIADGCHGVTRYQPTCDKIMRLNAQTAMIENRFVHIPETAPWLDEYLHELTVFPKGKHDDQVDSTAQFLDWFKKPFPGQGIFEFYRMRAERRQNPDNPERYRVRLLAPPGIGSVYTFSRLTINVGPDGTIEMSADDAQYLIRAGWTKLAEWTRDEAA